jgi:transcriptional regulator
MYLPEIFREQRFDALCAFVRNHPLAVLVASSAEGLSADYVPMLLSGPEGSCRLRGHIARANPLWKQLAAGAPVLALFSGAHHYVSPNLYPSKRDTGEVVPTWNYSTVQARGRIDWTQDRGWLRGLVSELTDEHERTQAQPWRVTDAPPRFLDAMLGAIVGFQIEVESLVGKFKASQNRSVSDRAGVRAAFIAEGLAPEVLAEIVRGE